MSVTIEEIAKHSSDSDRWRIIGDEVFDVMSFLGEDPGGKKATMLFAGRDATEEFDMLHDRRSSRSMASIKEPSRTSARWQSEWAG